MHLDGGSPKKGLLSEPDYREHKKLQTAKENIAFINMTFLCAVFDHFILLIIELLDIQYEKYKAYLQVKIINDFFMSPL